MGSPEAEVLDPADRLAIQDLYGRYTMFADDGDAEGWADCFTADGEFAVSGMEMAAVGREALVAMVSGHINGPRGAVLHHNTSICVDAAPGGAVGRIYAMEVFGIQVVSSVRYQDELVKVEGAWRIRKRTVTVKGITQLPELPTSATA